MPVDRLLPSSCPGVEPSDRDVVEESATASSAACAGTVGTVSASAAVAASAVAAAARGLVWGGFPRRDRTEVLVENW